MKYAAALVAGASPKGIGPVLAPDALPEDLLKARVIFERMTRETPGSVEAWAGLGSTYAYAGGDIAPGMDALERARALAPSRVDIAANLCLLYARGGQRVRARELYERVVSRSDDPALRLAGREAVFWGDVEDATRALDAGDRAAGLERLRSLAATAPSPAMKAQVEEQLRLSQDFVGRQGEVEAFNKAVAMANAKDYEGATKALEALLATSPGVTVAEPARRLLAEVRAVALYNDAVKHFNKQDFRGALALLDKMPKEVKGHPVVGAAEELRQKAKAALDGTPH
jgi:tetratricopeptide (TPR) repeat protein